MSGAPPETPAGGRSADDPLIGRTIAGKFVIERLLGAGAMGAVYGAHQTALERTIAIKVMHGGIAADPTYAARFHREAKAASRLDHPNLIRVLDYGQEPDGLLYIAMEFLDGRDLFAVLAEDWPLTHRRIVDILSQTLSALAEAHDAGVLHRDLKPENIMLLRRKAEDGTPVELVKVCDFGIAKLVEPGTESRPESGGTGRKLTSAGLVVGTPEYMSPEQARGESFDVRSDLYSIGVILYQLLTRRLPFEGKTPIDVVFKAMHEPPPPLSSHGATVAPGLDPVCQKAMSKAPEDRFQNAREMRVALRAAEPIARHLVIGGPNRVSIAHAPTQAEFVTPATSTDGGATVLGATRGTARGWRRLAVVAAAVVGAVAFFSWRHAPAPIAANPPSSAPLSVTAPTSASATLPRDEHGPTTPPPASAVVLTEGPSPVAPVSSSPHTTGHRVSRDVRQPASVPPDPPSPPQPESSSVAPASVPAVIAAAPVVPAAPSPPPPAEATPPPPPTPPPTQPAAPSFNLETARVDIGQVKSNNAAATSGNVSRALGPFATRFTACYRSALAQTSAAVTETVATLHLESDDQGYVTLARVSGPIPTSAARCIEGLSQRAHIDVDTGTANADVTLTFKPL